MVQNNENCYVSGWGLYGHNRNHATKEKLKFIRVTVVPPEKCKDLMPGDDFIYEMKPDENNNYPIICAQGHMGNTCKGDSGK